MDGGGGSAGLVAAGVTVLGFARRLGRLLIVPDPRRPSPCWTGLGRVARRRWPLPILPARCRTGTPAPTTGGRWSVAIVADFVALLAAVQVVALRRPR